MKLGKGYELVYRKLIAKAIKRCIPAFPNQNEVGFFTCQISKYWNICNLLLTRVQENGYSFILLVT